MIDKDKKTAIDNLFLKKMYSDYESGDINKSTYIRHIANKVPESIFYDNLSYDEVYDAIAFKLYENMITKSKDVPLEKILDNGPYMGNIYKLTEKNVLSSLSLKSRVYGVNKKKNYDSQKNISLNKILHDDSDTCLQDIISSKSAPITTGTFISNWFSDNYKIIFKNAPKTLDYIEHPYPRYSETSIRKTGVNKGQKNTIAYIPRIKKTLFKIFNDEYNTGLEISKKNNTPQEKQEIHKKNNYFYKIAEKKAAITIIDNTIISKHIGKEFNKHKDNRYLFDMFYNDISISSRKSINKEEYSIKSILELKAALIRLRKKLAKEICLNDDK